MKFSEISIKPDGIGKVSGDPIFNVLIMRDEDDESKDLEFRIKSTHEGKHGVFGKLLETIFDKAVTKFGGGTPEESKDSEPEKESKPKVKKKERAFAAADDREGRAALKKLHKKKLKNRK